MGSGKTTIGKSLARKLQYEFIDIDYYIEERKGKNIQEIFAEEGESKFRKFEQKILKEIIKKDNAVISCGGGTPCYNKNMELINKSGLSVYIKYPIGKLKSRLLPNMRKRPLLNNIGSPDDLESFIILKLKERENYYQKSKLILDNPKGTKDVIALITDFMNKNEK